MLNNVYEIGWSQDCHLFSTKPSASSQRSPSAACPSALGKKGHPLALATLVATVT